MVFNRTSSMNGTINGRCSIATFFFFLEGNPDGLTVIFDGD